MTLVRDYLTIIGLVCGTVVAVAAVSKTRIGRAVVWLYRKLIGDPVGAWFRRQVADEVHRVIDERLMVPNGGKSLHDISHKLDRLLERLLEEDS